MSKTEHPLQALAGFLPPHTFEPVAAFLQQYKVHLTITRERKSILGDYRHAFRDRAHRISVNGNLNPYSFLITLLHELAHLLTFDKYGNRVQSHGKEWKHEFGQLLAQFLQNRVFPADIEKELMASLHNPAASSCAEDGLMRVLRRYDPKTEGHMLVEEIPLNAMFRMKDGRVFKKGEKLRKRFRCEEVGTRKVYLFSPVFEVELVTE
ncbi:SprT-like domain-containing protein [Aridibaculum aurantiacum]|uniref:SprT-like domain-containing protein n=1 Tax=Aridibaculum aurantiacum TaxID=2810307 RepID=UPI001A973464|nr:SprT-like domain-containing protein [Aridibaculum aurantiacum]